MELTRRDFPKLALAAAPVPAAEEDPLKAARESVRRNSEALAKFGIPIETEPAFQFKP